MLASAYHNLGKIEQLRQKFSIATEHFEKSIKVLQAHFDEQDALLNKFQEEFRYFLSVFSRQNDYYN